MPNYPPLGQLGSPDPYGQGSEQPAPQQFAQASPIQMRPLGNGQVQVINVQTGQVLYTGPPSGAANFQAGGGIRRVIE